MKQSTESSPRFAVRVRGVIIDEGTLLVVSHAQKETFIVLPGGHLEWGEALETALRRELVEELGVEPVIGSLLYIHTFIAGDCHTTEFIFRIENGAAYRGCETLERTHAHELAAISWVTPSDTRHFRPAAVWDDFVAHGCTHTVTRRIADGVQ